MKRLFRTQYTSMPRYLIQLTTFACTIATVFAVGLCAQQIQWVQTAPTQPVGFGTTVPNIRDTPRDSTSMSPDSWGADCHRPHPPRLRWREFQGFPPSLKRHSLLGFQLHRHPNHCRPSNSSQPNFNASLNQPEKLPSTLSSSLLLRTRSCPMPTPLHYRPSRRRARQKSQRRFTRFPQSLRRCCHSFLSLALTRRCIRSPRSFSSIARSINSPPAM